jgi:hypothetical protein
LDAEEIEVSSMKMTNTSNQIVTVTEQLIGHKYTLTISGLDQFERKIGHTTADYSGIITVSLPADKIADRTGMILPEGKATGLLYKYYISLDTSEFDEEQLKEYIKGIKEAKLWNLCIEVIEKEFEIDHKGDFIRSILPIYTSVMRKAKRSLDVVDFWEMNTVIYSKYGSPEFFTSLAAAYCDIDNYIKARQYANRAYAMGGKASGELMNVYSRIKNH